MLTKLCKTCKWWESPHEKSNYNARDMCKPVEDNGEPMQFQYEVRICKQPTQTFHERPVEPNGFGVSDASEYFACLATAEDFGCVRHESND